MNIIFKQLDTTLNKITTYRLLAYGLSVLAVISWLFSTIDLISLSSTGLVLSFLLLIIVSYISNRFIRSAWGVATNNESWYITALILFFILPPATTPERAAYIILAAIIAMASKFILARRSKHFFNPAALAAGVLGLTNLLHASWWVGSESLWPITLIFGVLIVRKVRKYSMAVTFGLISIATSLVIGLINGNFNLQTISLLITSSPLIFLGTVMLTEPATMPPRRSQQIIYGIIVGIFFTAHPSIGSFYVYPEIALLIGNLYVYAVSPRYRLNLRLERVEKLSDDIFNYVFLNTSKIKFQPGQYLEWTLSHKKVDGRGNRRTFSIASSPTENMINLGFKVYSPSSSYKKALLAMKPGDRIYAGQLSGDFILPKDQQQKLVFIAGGIGITPFRSMLKYIIDEKQNRDVVLYYLVSDDSQIIYKDILTQAGSFGVKVIFVAPQVSGEQSPGFATVLDAALIRKSVPDFYERTYYISGPVGMVNNYKHLLQELSVPSRKIITDYFSGY